MLAGSAAAVNSLAFLSDTRLASITDQGVVALLDLSAGNGQTLAGLDGNALNVAASADGRLIVAGSSTGAIGRWDGANGQAQPALRSSLSAIYALALSPDGALLAAGGPPDDARVEIWDAASGKLLHTLPPASRRSPASRFSAARRALRRSPRSTASWRLGCARWHARQHHRRAAPG